MENTCKRINRNIVECKVYPVLVPVPGKAGINRNIVECKGHLCKYPLLYG